MVTKFFSHWVESDERSLLNNTDFVKKRSILKIYIYLKSMNCVIHYQMKGG